MLKRDGGNEMLKITEPGNQLAGGVHGLGVDEEPHSLLQRKRLLVQYVFDAALQYDGQLKVGMPVAEK